MSNEAGKRAAAKACIQAGLITQHQRVFLDCGSTFVYLAEAILKDAPTLAPLQVTTTNAEILETYLRSSNQGLIRLDLIGGRFIPHHCSFDGSNVVLQNVGKAGESLFDRAFIGVCPIDRELRVLATVTDVVEIKLSVLRASKEAVILCDSSKFREATKGTREVGRLQLTDDGRFVLERVIDNSFALPATVVVGLDGNEMSAQLAEFLARCKARGLSEGALVLGGRAASP